MTDRIDPAGNRPATHLFTGGAMGERMRALDWSRTAVGPVAGWPRGLEVAVRILLTSRHAMWLGWGPELTFFYNDACRPTLGARDPWALGASARAVWGEVWAEVGPRAEAVLRGGEDGEPLPVLERLGHAGETYHTFSFSPLADDAGAAGGILCVVSDDTERTVGRRRLALLGELAAGLATTRTEEDVFAAVKACLGAYRSDLPLALVYLFGPDGTARLAHAGGVAPGHPAAPGRIAPGAGAAAAWPADELLAGSRAVTVDLTARHGALPGGPWGGPPRQALLAPLALPGRGRPAGFLVAGLDPHRQPDGPSVEFVGLVAGQVAAGLANARAGEVRRRRAGSLAELRGEAEEARRVLQTLLEHVPEGITMTGGPPDFPLVAHSKRVREWLGVTAEEIEALPPGQLPPPAGLFMPDGVTRVAPDRLPLYRATRHGESMRDVERIVERRDGSRITVLIDVAPILDAQGRVVGAVNCWRDVTDRKRTEEALRRYAEQLRGLATVASRINAARDVASVVGVVTAEARALVGSHQAVTTVAPGGDGTAALSRVSFSDRYERWCGSPAEPDGAGLAALVCRTNRPSRLTHEEVERHPDYRRPGREAADRVALRGWLAAPLVGRDGRNLGLVWLSDRFEGEFSADDEAILVQLAQMGSVAIENARLYQELRDGDRRKDEFLATLGHELRNPLAPIRNSLHILRLANGGAASARVQEMMERQVNHMVRLVDDLLEVSRISRGQIQMCKEDVELAAVVRGAVDATRPLIDAGRHQLSIALPAEPVTVEADPVRLAQVIGNLLNNAAKYTPEGGHIALCARSEGGEVVLSVRDTGVGLPADMLVRVFEMFTQVDRTQRHSQGGLGIGLALVKSIVEMHGGRVEARSEGRGLGSEFSVRLPLAARQLPAPAPGVGGPPPEGAARCRVLVVDDSRDAADSLALLLELFGNEVRTAHDGPAALEALRDFHPRVVFLDIGMPGMDGYEVARRIRRQEGLQGVAVVALTGWGQDEDRRRSREAGFDQHLVKPVTVETIRATLASFVDPKPGARRLPAAP